MTDDSNDINRSCGNKPVGVGETVAGEPAAVIEPVLDKMELDVLEVMSTLEASTVLVVVVLNGVWLAVLVATTEVVGVLLAMLEK